MPYDSGSMDEQRLTTTSNTFWSTQTAKYPNYGTTKKRRFHEINYLVEKLKNMRQDVVSLTDVGCGTGSTVTVLQELTDIKTYHCYDISPAMISTIDASSKRGAHVQTTVIDFTNIDAMLNQAKAHETVESPEEEVAPGSPGRTSRNVPFEVPVEAISEEAATRISSRPRKRRTIQD